MTKDQLVKLENEFTSNYASHDMEQLKRTLGVEYLGFTDSSEGQAYLSDEEGKGKYKGKRRNASREDSFQTRIK